MEPVSSVTAFLYRYLRDPEAQAQEILNTLDGTERRAVELLISVPDRDERLCALSAATGTAWTASRYDYVVDRALSRLRRRLEQRRLLQS